MPGRQPEDWGVPLWEAIERWTPRELWERYRELAEYDIPLFILGGREDPRFDEARRLRSRISEILVNRLARGELIASGLHLPLRGSTRRRDVSSELWSRLELDLRRQEASGDGLRNVQLRVRQAAPAKPEPPTAVTKAQQPAPRRAHGRPSVMGEIEAEMRRRAEAGQLEPSLRLEAEALDGWAQRQFPDVHVPKPKSIQKKLGRIYKTLKATKRPDK